MTENHYFVDEAGDHRLFKKGTAIPIIGTPGCSRTFMVGVARLSEPSGCATALDGLRRLILSDDEFLGIPSVVRHTAVAFHACKDHPKVRDRVFDLLPVFGAKVTIAFKRKSLFVPMAIERGEDGKPAVIKPKKLYAMLLSRLLKNQLHKADVNRIIFAQRSDIKTDHAVRGAVAIAQRNFNIEQFNKQKEPILRPCDVTLGRPSQFGGLQVVDYYLWALQRAVEMGDCQYFDRLREGYRLIMDLDDVRLKPYGRWYSDGDPFVLQKMKAL